MKVNLSPLVVGVMNWGHWGKNFTPKEMAFLMNQCVELGLSSFDHAAIYGGYTTEAAFGTSFMNSGLNRSDIQLISKCGIQYPCENSRHLVKHYDYSAKEIIRSVEQSLVNLQTEYLDVLLFHRPSPLMHLNEIVEALTQLFDSGKVLSVGVSNFEQSKMDLLRSVVPIHFNQIEFSLSHHEPLTNGVLDYVQLHHIQPMAWKPLGTIFSNTNTPVLSQLLSQMSEKYQCTVDALLLAWILFHPSKVLPVIGTTNIERIKNQKNALQVKIDLEDWFALYEASLGHKVP
jgi:predicted oxidoreductase